MSTSLFYGHNSNEHLRPFPIDIHLISPSFRFQRVFSIILLEFTEV
jgi:hypothetical protein